MQSFGGLKDIFKDIDYIRILENGWTTIKWFIWFVVGTFITTILVKIFRTMMLWNLIEGVGLK